MENSQKQLAEKAYKLANDAFENGKYELARFYILNAITHDDSPDYFYSLISIVKKTSPDARRDVAEQALNLLSMALLQCDPDNVLKIQEMIDDLQSVYDETFNSASIATNFVSSTPQFADLNRYSWSAMKEALKQENLQTVQEKSEYLQQIMNSTGLSENQRKSVEQEFRTCISLMEFWSKKKALEETLSEINRELTSSKNVFFLAAKLQNVSSTLAQLWLLDVSPVIPNTECRSVLSKYAETIRTYEDKYGKLMSDPLYKDLRTKISKAKTDVLSASNTRTQQLEILRKAILEISEQIYQMSAPDYIRDIQKALRELEKKAEEISQKRFAAYQKRIAELCHGAIKQYDSDVKVFESDAKEYLKKYQIAEIDESLLAPETASIFHEAKGLLVNKLSLEAKAAFQVRCVTGAKIKLEDF